MLLKRFKITTEKDVDIDKNAYFLDNETVKSYLIEYCTVLMHTDNQDNTIDINQMLKTDTLYCCIYTKFEMIKK